MTLSLRSWPDGGRQLTTSPPSDGASGLLKPSATGDPARPDRHFRDLAGEVGGNLKLLTWLAGQAPIERLAPPSAQARG